jgi:hypothetical protein
VTASFTLDGVNDGSGPLSDFQLAVLPATFRDLTRVTFLGSFGASLNAAQFSLDNVESAAVPEPGTSAFVLAGLLGLAGWRRARALARTGDTYVSRAGKSLR